MPATVTYTPNYPEVPTIDTVGTPTDFGGNTVYNTPEFVCAGETIEV